VGARVEPVFGGERRGEREARELRARDVAERLEDALVEEQVAVDELGAGARA
jgi:hypothetical protein